MDIVENIVFERNKTWYKKMTVYKMLVHLETLDIHVDNGITMEDLVKLCETYGYRFHVKLFYPTYEKVFEYRSKPNKTGRKFIFCIYW